MATIITKNSQTASAVPAAASLSVGELAVNTADGKLYTEHTGGVVKEIIPSTVVDGGITTAKVADGAITSAKIATGAVIADDLATGSVTMTKISATGTPSSSTFLRGDGQWQTPSASISDGSITDPKISDGLTADTTYYPITSGNTIPNTAANTSLNRIASFRCLRGGVFNFRFKIQNINSESAITLGSRIYVNGSAVGSTISSLVQPTAARTDTHTSITVTRNQVVDVYGSTNNGSGNELVIVNIQYGAVGSIAVNAFTNGCSATTSTTSLPI
jgi:hypothetical protein